MGAFVLYDLAVFLLLLMAITMAKAVPRVLRDAIRACPADGEKR